MKNLDSLKKRLKNELPEEGISHVIQSLKGILPENSPKYNLLINLESEYKEFKLKFVEGSLAPEVINRTNAEIRSRIMTLIDALEEDDFDATTPQSNFSEEQTYKKGHVLYQIPKKMQAFQETRCRVRIAFDKMMLLEDLDLNEDTKIKPEVRISDYMKVEIIDPTNNEAFEIRSTSDPVQFIDQDDFTEWKYYVKPLLSGEQILELKVSVIVLINGNEVKREKTLEESVVIIAEEVKDEETPFVKTMEDMVLPTTETGSNTAATAAAKTVSRTSKSVKPNTSRGSGFRLPKSLKSLALGLLSLIVVSTGGYAFIPGVELEVDWFVADKIGGDKESYNDFVEKHKGKKGSSTRVQKLIVSAVQKVDNIEWKEIELNPSVQLVADYLKKYDNEENAAYALERIENAEYGKFNSRKDTIELVKNILKYQYRFPDAMQYSQAQAWLQDVKTTDPQINDLSVKFQAARTGVVREDKYEIQNGMWEDTGNGKENTSKNNGIRIEHQEEATIKNDSKLQDGNNNSNNQIFKPGAINPDPQKGSLNFNDQFDVRELNGNNAKDAAVLPGQKNPVGPVIDKGAVKKNSLNNIKRSDGLQNEKIRKKNDQGVNGKKENLKSIINDLGSRVPAIQKDLNGITDSPNVKKSKSNKSVNSAAMTKRKKGNEPISTVKKFNFKKGSFTDSRDKQIYPTIFINGEWWMAKNLNFKTKYSYCYGNKNRNCQIFGRLYTWNAAMNACPDGWRLPTDKEWSGMLVSTFGKKEDCVACFNSLMEGGDSGFNALLGGYSKVNGSSWQFISETGFYWGSTIVNSAFVWGYSFSKLTIKLERDNYHKGLGFSCRCIKD